MQHIKDEARMMEVGQPSFQKEIDLLTTVGLYPTMPI